MFLAKILLLNGYLTNNIINIIMDKLKKMKRAYSRQKSNARRRKIAWKFSFQEWQLKWEESGKWDERGRKGHQYVMCRYNDEGPYSYFNTKIDTSKNNKIEANKIMYKDHVYKVYPKVKEGRGRPFGTGKTITIFGVTYTSKQSAADSLGIKRTTLLYRLKQGYYK